MNVTPASSPLSAADLSVERLAANRTLPEREQVARASRAFEAVLLRQILSDAQKPLLARPTGGSQTAGEIYRDMVSSQLADQIAASGSLGLGRTFEAQLQTPPPAGEAPASRPPASARVTQSGSSL